MEAERPEGSLSFHPSKSSHKLDLAGSEAVSGMQDSVHIGECHGAEELWVFLVQFRRGHGAGWDF
jgi:hypothetical protein